MSSDSSVNVSDLYFLEAVIQVLLDTAYLTDQMDLLHKPSEPLILTLFMAVTAFTTWALFTVTDLAESLVSAEYSAEYSQELTGSGLSVRTLSWCVGSSY